MGIVVLVEVGHFLVAGPKRHDKVIRFLRKRKRGIVLKHVKERDFGAPGKCVPGTAPSVSSGARTHLRKA